MNTRYYWTQNMQDVRWKTIDYDGTLVEWFAVGTRPIPNMTALKWEGDKFGIKRAMSQKFSVIDEYGNNIWHTTIEENPYYVPIRNPDIPLEGPKVNNNPFEKASPEYQSPFDVLSKNSEINRLRDRAQKLEKLLDSSIQHNIELIKLLHSREYNDEIAVQGLNKDWWERYKAIQEQELDKETMYSKKLRVINDLKMERDRNRKYSRRADEYGRYHNE